MAKRLLFLLPALIFAVVVGYFVWGLTDPDRNPSEVPSAMVGQPVPEIDLPPIDGGDLPGLKTADLRNGRVTLVNFFASWCIPCRAEHPLLMDLADEGTVRLVGINYKDRPVDALNWLDELGNPYERIGADHNARAGIEFGVSGVPETYVIDREGRIRYQRIGPIDHRELEDRIRPLVEELSQ